MSQTCQILICIVFLFLTFSCEEKEHNINEDKTIVLEKDNSKVNRKGFTTDSMQDPEFWTTEEGVALGGHDPVAFYQGKKIMGSKENSFTWKSVTYHFSTEENKDTFILYPEKFAPPFKK